MYPDFIADCIQTHKVYDSGFKLECVKYKLKHKELTYQQAADMLKISVRNLNRWCNQFKKTGSVVSMRRKSKGLTEQLSCSCNPQLADFIRKKAEARNMDVSSYLRTVLSIFMRKQEAKGNEANTK